jgi:predicted permease
MSAPWGWRRRSVRLARRLPPASAGAVLGDLHEEYRARIARDGRVRTEWWLLRQTWSLARAYAHYESPRGSFWPRLRFLRANDLTQTLRSLARTPWYAATAIAVIALGTALGTSIFAIVDGTLFKPVPYPGSSRLFAVSLGYSRLPEPLAALRPVSPATLAEWRTRVPDIAFAAYDTGSSWQPVGRHDSVRRVEVDRFFFDVLGVRPLVGGFSPEDFDAVTAIRPAVVTAKFWRERFGDSPPRVGQVLTSDTGAGIRIVGILPDTFVFPWAVGAASLPQLLTPSIRAPTELGNSLRVLGRIAPNTDVRSAAEHLNAVVVAQAAARPREHFAPTVAPRTRIQREGYDRGGLEPIDLALRRNIRNRAWVVFVAAAALVLLACFNVTGLTVARARERHRDLVVRRALGAGTRDLIRLLAIESMAVVSVGTAGGLLLAWWTLPFGARLFAGDFMLTLKPAVIDARVAVFAALLAIAGSAIVILLAARAVARAGLRQGLAEGAGGTRRAAKRLSMVSFEVAVAYLVTVTAALFVGSLIRVWSENVGFDVPGAAVLKMSAPRNSTADDIERLVADVGKLPGVQAAGGVAHPILEVAFNGSAFDTPPGITPPAESRGGPGTRGRFPIESIPVTGGFFPAAGLDPRDGRLPTDEEFRKGAPVIVITENVARAYWPGKRAVGQELMKTGKPFEVIGVVNDTRFLSLDEEELGQIFWPLAAMLPRPYLDNIVVRLAPGSADSIGVLATTVRERCPDCWMRESITLEKALAETIRPRRFSAWLFSGFGIAALLIVGTGILGVVAMTSSSRVREIGIRMALGATSRGVRYQLLREQIMSVVLGIAMGAVAAWWATTYVTSYLYETTPTDAIAWTAAAAAIILVACVGAFVPARRASRIDPVKALRAD